MSYSTTSKYVINGRTYSGTSLIVKRAFEQGTVTGDTITEIKSDGTRVTYNRSGNTFVPAGGSTSSSSGTTSNTSDRIIGGMTISGNLPTIEESERILSRLPTYQSPTQSTQSITSWPNADQLVERALREDATYNLGANDWWSQNPNKSTAWRMIQSIFESPENLANYVKQRGITNLNQYRWWNESPYKQEAWNIISGGQTQPQEEGFYDAIPPQFDPVTQGEIDRGERPAGTTAEDAQKQAEEEQRRLEEAQDKKLQEALEMWRNSGLPPELISLGESIIRKWDFGKEVNPETLKQEFLRVRSERIDPYYQELSTAAIRDIDSAVDFQMKQRDRELEAERYAAGQDIRQARSELESRGMTFTGAGVEELGALSAFAREGKTGIPNQLQYEGAGDKQGMTFEDRYFEGRAPMRNRLIASSSEARYKENMEALGRRAENYLGSDQAALLNIPGFGVTPGGITGELAQKREAEERGLLTDILSKGITEAQQSYPIASKYTLPAY